jgi:CheY-like chemotaxis protein
MHVEDNAAIRESVKLVLEKEGHEVVSYETAAAAIDALPREKPDLAILDIMMESMDSGLEVNDKIQKTRPGLPCIFLTSLGEEVQQMFAGRLQNGRILQKPVKPETLIPVVNKLLQ